MRVDWSRGCPDDYGAPAVGQNWTKDAPVCEVSVKQLLASLLCAACLASSTQAGGPIVVVEDPEPEVTERSPSSKGWLPWLVIPLFLCVVMCGPEDK